MKILLIPMDFHRHKESPELFTDMLDAFNSTAEIYTDNDQALWFEPDVILFQASLSWVQLIELKAMIEMGSGKKPLICMYTGDAPFLPTKGLMDYRNIVDFYLLPFSGEALKRYETFLLKPCHFMWEPIQSWRFIPNQTLEEGMVTFVGNYYSHLPGSTARRDIIDLMDQGERIEVRGLGFGDRHPIDYQKVPKLYNDSYAVICENNYSDRQDYFTPRNLGAIAAGSVPLHKYFPGIEKFFQNGINGLYYNNKYELLECIQFLRANPEIRNKIADNAFKLANANFTMKNWVGQFIHMLRISYGL